MERYAIGGTEFRQWQHSVQLLALQQVAGLVCLHEDDKFRLGNGEEKLTTYRWTPAGKPKPNLSYHSCSQCGVRTHANGVGPDGSAMVAVQVATIEDADPDVLARSINYVDGIHDHFDKVPADTRLL